MTTTMEKFDKVMAMIRHPEYKEEYAKYVKLYNTNEDKARQFAREIEKKWGEYPPPRVFPPYYNIEGLKGYMEEPIVEVEQVSPEFPSIKITSYLTELIMQLDSKVKSQKTFPSSELQKDEVSSAMGELLHTLREKSIVEGKYLYLRVDLTRRESTLRDAFQRKLAHYKSYPVLKDSRKDKETNTSPWLVFDLVHFYKIKFPLIAQKLSGRNEKPTDNDIVFAWYKQVKYAYDKAVNIIVSLGEELNLRSAIHKAFIESIKKYQSKKLRNSYH
jgi:hypothetical protein